MSSELPPFSVRVHTSDDSEICRLELAGEIDLVTSERLDRAFEAIFELRLIPTEIQVDLAGVTFMDTMGVGAILRGRRLALSRGRRFVVTSTSPVIERLLEMTGIATLLYDGT
jgi:anti-sigma B factor antagonist